jgi:hypothetical protein
MPEFFSRKGERIELMEWAVAYEDTSIRNVAVDVEDNIMVSTIWEGMCSPLSLYPDLLPRGIFETAVLIDGEIQNRRRWDTEAEALANHALTCRFFLHRDPDNGETRAEILRREAENRAAQGRTEPEQ